MLKIEEEFACQTPHISYPSGYCYFSKTEILGFGSFSLSRQFTFYHCPHYVGVTRFSLRSVHYFKILHLGAHLDGVSEVGDRVPVSGVNKHATFKTKAHHTLLKTVSFSSVGLPVGNLL